MEPRREIERTSGTTLLVVGFACTLVLAISTLGLAAYEVERAQHRILEVAERAQDVTYYLGDVAEQLSRSRSQVALGVRVEPDGVDRYEQLARIASQLERDVEWLTTGIDPRLADRWTALRSELERLGSVHAEAASLIRARRRREAEQLIDTYEGTTTRVHEALNSLQQAHREQSSEALTSAERRTARIRRIEAYLVAVFLAGMLAIWGNVIIVLRRQQRRLRDYTLRIESANAELDAFAGRVAHDLKNALGPIVMAPELLRSSAKDSTRVLETAARIQRCSQRTVAILDALLSFSRASSVGADTEAGEIAPAVKNVLDELAPVVEKLRVSVEREEMPDVFVRCSPELLHVVLTNLCGNAVKYLEGRRERRIRIVAFPSDDGCRIEVHDTGPGIPKEDRERIFEPFYRGRGARAPGTGIGLATVHRIVDARGGWISVDSEEGRGSCFTLWLPIAARKQNVSHSSMRPPPREERGAAREDDARDRRTE